MGVGIWGKGKVHFSFKVQLDAVVDVYFKATIPDDGWLEVSLIRFSGV